MSWNDVLLFILATSGAVILLLSQIRDILLKFSEVIIAWREMRRSLPSSGDRESEEQ